MIQKQEQKVRILMLINATDTQRLNYWFAMTIENIFKIEMQKRSPYVPTFA